MAKKQVATSWKTTANRYVAYFDILGFKDYISSNSHSIVIKRMNYLNSILDTVEYIGSAKAGIKTVIFSDSIFIFSKDDSLENLHHILSASNWLVSRCVAKKIPIKGSVGFGKITVDFTRSIFFGKSISETFLLQEEISFIGCILHHSIEDKIPKNDAGINVQLIESKVFLKSGLVTHKWINWITAYVEEGDSSATSVLKRAFEGLAENYKHTSSSPRKYTDNTIDMINSNKEKIINQVEKFL